MKFGNKMKENTVRIKKNMLLYSLVLHVKKDKDNQEWLSCF